MPILGVKPELDLEKVHVILFCLKEGAARDDELAKGGDHGRLHSGVSGGSSRRRNSSIGLLSVNQHRIGTLPDSALSF